jgi:hypothetical protein
MLFSEGERTIVKISRRKGQGFQGSPKGCKEFTEGNNIVLPNIVQTDRAKGGMSWEGEETLQKKRYLNNVEFQGNKIGR